MKIEFQELEKQHVWLIAAAAAVGSGRTGVDASAAADVVAASYEKRFPPKRRAKKKAAKRKR
jgi:hypothetical protein